MKTFRASESGFTLLEMMIALAIIATALVTLLGLSQRTILVQDKVQRVTRATLLAQQLMNEEEYNISQSGLEQNFKEDVFPEPFTDFRWEISYQDTLIRQIKEVNVRVIWGDPDKNEEVRLVSFVPVGSAG